MAKPDKGEHIMASENNPKIVDLSDDDGNLVDPSEDGGEASVSSTDQDMDDRIGETSFRGDGPNKGDGPNRIGD